MPNTLKKTLQDLGLDRNLLAGSGWQLFCVQSEQCLSYVAWNEREQEALVVDPKCDDFEAYVTIAQGLAGYLWLGVVDTHTHADHVSAAADLAARLGAPLIMHEKSQSRRVDIRVCRETRLPARSATLRLVPTPGHTPDSLTIIWGPFLFGGDTILFGDIGRDDLPGGDPAAHYESVQLIKSLAADSTILLPGHDHKGGRASTWKAQLGLNASLTQSREDFIREAAAYEAPAPALLKESLRENLK